MDQNTSANICFVVMTGVLIWFGAFLNKRVTTRTGAFLGFAALTFVWLGLSWGLVKFLGLGFRD